MKTALVASALILISSFSAFAQSFKGTSEVFPNSRNQANTQLIITGKSARAIFENISVPVRSERFGSVIYFRKVNKQMVCTREVIPSAGDAYSCAFLIGFRGGVLPISEL